eukprot:Tamp_20738.p1 GENE.Tamp_20738~~Tamp_20738.p1  ORF type:complete len:359 (-),score=46.49 Tamp_20738:104-1075(-)
MRGSTRFQCTAVAFSPFEERQIAVSSAQHFGIVGNGCQSIFVQEPRGLVEVRQLPTQDAVLDCCWSECNGNQLISACGDGSVKLWDLSLQVNRPFVAFKEHQKEVHAVSWNPVDKHSFLSASWDSTIKLWSPASMQSMSTWRVPKQGSVYSVAWSPRWSAVFASGSQDKLVKVFDTRSPKPAAVMVGHGHEVLSVDWCKYDDFLLASGSADSTGRIWDLRMPQQQLLILNGHRFAVRRIKFSPFSATQVVTCSYDLTVAVWEISGPPSQGPQRGPMQVGMPGRFAHHKEFVTGLDFSLFQEGELASCSWDRSVCLWSPGKSLP